MAPARWAALVMVVAAGLAGCGKFYWTKPGSTLEDFERDSTECARATSVNPTAAAVGNVNMKAYRACLAQRGYVRDQHVMPPPDAYRGFE
jgi:hypothetical protein